MPLRKTQSGWMWGSKHFKTKAAAVAARRAAYAAGYKGEQMVSYSIKNGQAVEDNESDDSLGEMMFDLLHSATVTHIMHLQSESFAEHMALGEYYEAIPDLVDALIEAWQGKNQQILRGYGDYEESYEGVKPLDYLQELRDEFTQCRPLIGDDTELQNLADSIAEQIDSTMYKLRFLK